MSVQYKDYYGILGISRSASADEIRKAFRKLARKYHPDVTGNNPAAEAKFKEVNEAYEVLGDPEKRKKYDALGSGWTQGANFRPPPGFARARGRRRAPSGVDEDFFFGGTGFSEFFETIFGSENEAEFGRAGETFGRGSGSARGADTEADLLVTLQEALNGSVRPVTVRRQVVCPTCFGATQVNGRRCEACWGQGSRTETETYQVKVPPGVTDGARLRLAGRGERGAGGAHSGDLFLRVRLAKHPDFQVERENLVCDVDLAPWEAVLGAEVAVPTLEGKISIRIPPGSQNGQRMRLRERGLPNSQSKRGDLIIQLRVKVPTEVGATERALWEQLARKSSYSPRD